MIICLVDFEVLYTDHPLNSRQFYLLFGSLSEKRTLGGYPLGPSFRSHLITSPVFRLWLKLIWCLVFRSWISYITNCLGFKWSKVVWSPNGRVSEFWMPFEYRTSEYQKSKSLFFKCFCYSDVSVIQMSPLFRFPLFIIQIPNLIPNMFIYFCFNITWPGPHSFVCIIYVLYQSSIPGAGHSTATGCGKAGTMTDGIKTGSGSHPATFE